MKLSTRSRYGTRLLVDLARYVGKGPVRISEISSRQKIPLKYLEQIIRPLKKANLVTSVRGAKGGHLLAKKPEEITLGKIFRLFETQTDRVEYVSDPEKCSMSDDYRVWLAWQAATQAFYKNLDEITIADLIGGTPNALNDTDPCIPSGMRGHIKEDTK